MGEMGAEGFLGREAFLAGEQGRRGFLSRGDGRSLSLLPLASRLLPL